MTREWTTAEVQHLLQLLYKGGMSYREIADALGRDREGVRSKIRRINGTHTAGRGAEQEPAVSFPLGEAFEQRNDSAELVVENNNVLVAGDFHVPAESKKWVKKLLSYADEHAVEALIINGDFWNFDQISRWQMKDPELTLKAEIKRGIELVTLLAKKFKAVYFVCGNHDSRLPKALNYSLNFSDWMEALFSNLKNVYYTNFDFLTLVSGTEQFRVCHPQYYSRVKGSEVGRISHDLQENVIMAHQHYVSFATNKTGRYICIDGGCMCDQNAFYYKKSSTTKFPSWENAFVHVRSGKVHVVSEFTF